jgi:putative nucleotidyltransferase with HDIG domain
VFGSKKHKLRYKSSQKQRLPVTELRPGMFVAELDRPWEETPFLFQGFTIETEHEIEVLAQYCETVTIDIESSIVFTMEKSGHRATGTQSKTTAVHKRTQSVERELSRAQRAHKASSRLIRTIMDDVRLGKSIDTPAAKEAVTETVDSVIANQDAMALLTRVREKDEYTSQHSLSVSILTIALGRHVGMERDELIELGMCGLLHDVGKIMTPDEVLKKPGRLTDEEMDIMREHARHGRDIIMSSSGAPMKALDVAHAHHERFDGMGYPRGLLESQITQYTRMVAITDTFDAITSDRSYDNARSNMDAFQILGKGRGHQWDPKLVIRFIEAIGIFPAGTAVELSNQLIGVVIETHPTLKLRPKVILTHGPGGPLQPPMLVNLATTEFDESGNHLKVQRVLPPAVAGIDLHELRENGILENIANLPEYRRGSVPKEALSSSP